MHKPVPPTTQKSSEPSVRTRKNIQSANHVTKSIKTTDSQKPVVSLPSLTTPFSHLQPLPSFHKPSPSSFTEQKPVYLSRRIIPVGSLAHGTWFSENSDFFDLASIKSYYNWKYKYYARLPGDMRPVWK